MHEVSKKLFFITASPDLASSRVTVAEVFATSPFKPHLAFCCDWLVAQVVETVFAPGANVWGAPSHSDMSASATECSWNQAWRVQVALLRRRKRTRTCSWTHRECLAAWPRRRWCVGTRWQCHAWSSASGRCSLQRKRRGCPLRCRAQKCTKPRCRRRTSAVQGGSRTWGRSQLQIQRQEVEVPGQNRRDVMSSWMWDRRWLDPLTTVHLIALLEVLVINIYFLAGKLLDVLVNIPAHVFVHDRKQEEEFLINTFLWKTRHVQWRDGMKTFSITFGVVAFEVFL